MEIYAIYNWKASPFNSELSTNGENYVFLQVLLDPELIVSKTLHTMNQMDKYILCSFPLEAIKAIFPHDIIEVTAVAPDATEQTSTMIINKVILDDNFGGKIVQSKKEGELSVFSESFNIDSNTLTLDGVREWLQTKQNSGEIVNFINVNCSVSRDPPSCRGKI